MNPEVQKLFLFLLMKTGSAAPLKTLEIVREATVLPLLHKEFIITPYQLLEGRLRGASAALILAYYFQQAELAKIITEAKTIGLEAVVECSLETELPRALAVNPDIFNDQQ